MPRSKRCTATCVPRRRHSVALMRLRDTTEFVTLMLSSPASTDDAVELNLNGERDMQREVCFIAANPKNRLQWHFWLYDVLHGRERGETASANVNQRQRQRWRTVGGHANRRWTILALSKLSLRGKVRFVGDFRLDGRANGKAPVSSLAFFSLAVRSQRSPSGSQGPAAAAGSWLVSKRR